MNTTPAPEPNETKKPNSTWIDMGPILAYVIAFNIARKVYPDAALYIGAGVFAVAVTISVIYSKIKLGKVSAMLWVTAIIVIGSAAITIGFQNKTVFYMKPTAINILFGLTILGSLIIKKNVFKAMMGEAYTLPDSAWRTLAWRWGFFFLFLAGLNEFIWRNFSEAFWSNFKLMGMFPITIVFTLINLPLLLKHMPQNDDQSSQKQ
ncbi:MAG: intracellular septation protein A [Robiginitomaculum sp.]|nr:MAG: intracellular septation protein A [Robiginitomaculum sp.]